MNTYHVGDTHVFTSYLNDVVYLKGNRGALDLQGTVTVNGAPIGSGGGGGATGLNGLDDVVLTSPEAGEPLIYDGTNWVNSKFLNGIYTEENVGGYKTGLSKATSVIPTGTTGAGVFANFTSDLSFDPNENDNNYNNTLIGLGSNISKRGTGDLQQLIGYNISCDNREGNIGNLVGVNVNMYKENVSTSTDSFGVALSTTHKSTNSSYGMNMSLNEKGTPNNFEGISMTMTNDARVNGINGLNMNLTNTGGATSWYGININMTGTVDGLTDSVAPINCSTDSLIVTGPYERKIGINVGGFINAGGQKKLTNNYATVSGGNPVDFGHLLAHQVYLTEDTTECDYIGTNAACVILAEHNYTSSSTFDLGITPVGYVGQMAVKTGKTVNKISMATAAMVNLGGQFSGSDNGTVTDLNMYYVKGTLPAGGNTQVTNLSGLKIDAGLNYIGAANAWGIYDDSDANNYFKKNVLIGGTTGHSKTGVQISNDKNLVFKGSSPSTVLTAATLNDIVGNENCGRVSITTGATGTHQFALSYAVAHENAPIILLTPANDEPFDYYVDSSVTHFDVFGFSSSKTYIFNYLVVGR